MKPLASSFLFKVCGAIDEIRGVLDGARNSSSFGKTAREIQRGLTPGALSDIRKAIPYQCYIGVDAALDWLQAAGQEIVVFRPTRA